MWAFPTNDVLKHPVTNAERNASVSAAFTVTARENTLQLSTTFRYFHFSFVPRNYNNYFVINFYNPKRKYSKYSKNTVRSFSTAEVLNFVMDEGEDDFVDTFQHGSDDDISSR